MRSTQVLGLNYEHALNDDRSTVICETCNATESSTRDIISEFIRAFVDSVDFLI